MEFIINSRPVCQDEQGSFLTRFNLTGNRAISGLRDNIFEKEMALNHAGRFQDRIEEIEDQVVQFWKRLKILTIEKMLEIQKERFPGEIIPQLHDLVSIPDKINRAGGFAIGEIVEIKDADDNEHREVVVEISRKSARSHPNPLRQKTTKLKKFTRHIQNLIFLQRPVRAPDGKILNRQFLYEDLIGNTRDIDTQY